MKNVKKVLITLLALVMILSTVSVAAFAATAESEKNDTVSAADLISVNGNVTGTLSTASDVDYFKFTTRNRGYISVTFKHTAVKDGETNWFVDICAEDGAVIRSFELSGKKEELTTGKVGLGTGTYLVKISGEGAPTVSYKFCVNFQSSTTWEAECNNSIETASALTPNSKATGTIGVEDDVDFYKLTMTNSGYVCLDFSHGDADADVSWMVTLLNSAGDILVEKKITGDKTTAKTSNVGIAAGTYYVKVTGEDVIAKEYSVRATYASSKVWETEKNDTTATATPISIAKAYSGALSLEDDIDFFKFTLDEDDTVIVALDYKKTGTEDTLYTVEILSSDNDTLEVIDAIGNDDSVKTGELDLNAGTYYIKIIADAYTGTDYSVKVTADKQGASILTHTHSYSNHYCASCGKFEAGYSGMAKKGNTWYYVTDGSINYKFTGMAKNDYGWWYIKDGKLDLTYTGMAKNDYGWWYMKNGKLDLTYTGMAKNQYNWWYMKNGKLDTTFTGLIKNQYGWWYLSKGTIDYKYVGLVKNQYGWWYVKNGTIAWTYNGTAKNAYGTYKVVNGKATTKIK